MSRFAVDCLAVQAEYELLIRFFGAYTAAPTLIAVIESRYERPCAYRARQGYRACKTEQKSY